MILKVMNENTKSIQKMIPSIVSALSSRSDCTCRQAAAGVIATDSALIPYQTKRKLWAFYGKYWKDLLPL
jgi:hypothetical protein